MNEPQQLPKQGTGRGRVPSLTTRLIAGYTLVALAVLSLCAVFLYRGLKNGFIQEDTELLGDQILLIRNFLEKPDGMQAAMAYVHTAAGEREVEKYYARLLDEQGREVDATPGIADLAPADVFPAPVGPEEKVERVTERTDSAGRYTMMAAARARTADGRTLVAQVVLDAGHVEEWLTSYRRQLYGMIAGGSVLIAVLGIIITRRGLRPLRHISDAMQSVTAREMQRRLGDQPWPEELGAVAREFDRMMERLRDSFTRLSQFSADVAHEFRTPLNNLMGGTGVALSRPRTEADYRAALESSLEQYERLEHMIESLLFIARADNAETPLQRSALDAAKVCGDVCDYFSALTEERGIALELSAGGTLHADESLFRMALTNLISNAIRHTPRGGRVKVTLQPGDSGSELVVSDTGCGIAGEHLPHLFDRFYRADSARSGAHGGTGLGLAIVRTIAQLHGGKAEVESAPGEGTVFRVRFPEPAD